MAQPPGSDYIVSETKRMKFDDLICVKVGVGQKSKSYTIYSSALTTRSLFFRNALSRSWREATERAVHLSHDDIELFELYLHLVHNNEFACKPDPPRDQNYGMEENLALAKLYVFCQKIQDTRAKNSIVKAMIDSVDNTLKLPNNEVLDILYEGTGEGSPIRRLLVDMFVTGLPTEHFSIEQARSYPIEFLQEFAVCLLATFDLRARQAASPFDRVTSAAAYLEEERTE